MKKHFEQLEQTMAQTPSFDGEPAKLIHLTNTKGMTASFMDIGATWLSCTLPMNGGHREILLRSPSMAEHMKQGAYFGSIVGRFANRIAKGQFELEGRHYQLDINNGENSLHGGFTGFDKRRWTIVEHGIQQVVFLLNSEDGDQGYPGKLDVRVTYTLTDDNEVVIFYDAKVDKACPVNLTNHAYFNLAGTESDHTILDHSLFIKADQFLPTDPHGIPLSGPKSVIDTGFDFRVAKSIGRDLLKDEQQQASKGYDHSYLLPDKTDLTVCAAQLKSPDAKVTMSVFTTKPAIQLYCGNWLSGTPNWRCGVYQGYAGVALETQYLPDAPNHPEWQQPSCITLPGKEYAHTTIYQFDV